MEDPHILVSLLTGIYVVTSSCDAQGRPYAPRARLRPHTGQVEQALASDERCKDVVRLTSAELDALARDLRLYRPDDHTLNWRFTPRQRLFLALYLFSNYAPSRKLRFSVGWSANSHLNNWRYHIGQIITCLDSSLSRKHASDERRAHDWQPAAHFEFSRPSSPRTCATVTSCRHNCRLDI
jgi:hypothetical protein